MSEAPSAHDRLATLQRQGAARLAPARWRQLQALARRLSGQPEPVRAVLQARLDDLLDDLLDALARRIPAGEAVAPGALTAPVAQATAAPSWPRPAKASPELASAARFRQAWSHVRAQDSVSQALAQRPAQAGPLNSHALALQSLSLMNALPAGYLRRFVAHLEALQWLEAIAPQVAPPARARKPQQARQARPADKRRKP